MPGDKILTGYIKKTVELNEAGIKNPAHAKPKKKLVVPDYFLAALKKNKRALAAFENFSPSCKREYIEWITEAKREETRVQRLNTAIQWLAAGKSRNWKYLWKRSAAFTPLQCSHKQNARNSPESPYNRSVKRHQRRAPCTMESPKPIRRAPPKNVGLLELIRAKREWDWKPSIEELKKGFRGWHQRGFLPHFDAPDVTQFVTFQLDDSFPITRRAEWEAVLRESDDSAKRKQLEAWLDRGHGECWLRRQDVAELVEKILLEADGHDYRMQAWVIMPNHVHLVVDVWAVPLAKLIGGWKGKSSRIANALLHRSGKFWQEDYYDTLVRDEAHLKRAIRYTEQNPVKAFLVKAAREWPSCSARHRDKYERLPWQRSA